MTGAYRVRRRPRGDLEDPGQVNELEYYILGSCIVLCTRVKGKSGNEEIRNGWICLCQHSEFRRDF